MIDVVDPNEIDRAEYIAALNRCFTGWGGEAMFDWCYRRVVADRVPDLLVVGDGGRWIAGCGVVYRNVRTDNEAARAGILCGAWTEPEARGRGLFSDIAEAARVLTLRRDAAMLLAFVRADNASARRLAALGWTMVPARYLRGSGQRAALAPCEAAQDDFGRQRTHFVYTNDEWRAQFVHRPQQTECIAGEGWRAILEGNRLLDVAGDRRRALHDFGEVFAYSTTSEEWPGFEATPGFLAGIGDMPTEWDIRNGDRM